MVLLFTLVLLVHIVIMVKKMPVLAFPTVQMARVDFKKPLDSISIRTLQNSVASEKGVGYTYYNHRDNILIYTFDNRLNTSDHIYKEAISPIGYESVKYIVAAKDMDKGCPVMNNSSFYGKLTDLVAGIVNK